MSGRAIVGTLTLCLASGLPVQEYEDCRAPIKQILADELRVPFELEVKWRSGEPSEQRLWADANVVYLNVGPRADYREGYFVVDETTQQVVGFVGPEPKGPVRMEVMVAEQALAIATEFCHRHLAGIGRRGLPEADEAEVLNMAR